MMEGQGQCRLLRLAIGQKVTCPGISNVSLTECPDDPRPDTEQALIMNNTYERMRALVSTIATMPILPCGRKID